MSRSTGLGPVTVSSVLGLYERRGHEHYGEDVTQLQHALQCAEHAACACAADELVAAALLHDVGHLIADERSPEWRDDVDDDRHEAAGARIVASLLGPRAAAPVALHVTAKRWRCAVDPTYHAALSTASAASLVAQGGPLDAAACARFEAHRAFDDAVALRGWDDAAKDPAASVGSLGDFEPLLARLAAGRT